MPIYVPPAAPTGVLRWDWVDRAGVVHDFTHATSPERFVSRGTAGLGAAPVELVLEKLPFMAGSLLRYTQTRPLEIELPIVVSKTAMAALLTEIENLREWFDTGNEEDRDPGYLRVTRPQDDAVRQIACFYAGGLEGALQEGSPTYVPLVVSLVAPDPAWTDVEETEVTYDSGDIGATLGVINTGDYPAYPIWTIAGPASAITLTNLTTGKALPLTADGGIALLSTDVLTIDTRPSSQRTTLPIVDQDGISFYSKVAIGGALWHLAPGQNNFRIAASGTSGATSFGLRWLPRYRGVLR